MLTSWHASSCTGEVCLPAAAAASLRVQASANGRIVAREQLRALRKDVLAKCYGGDVSRKRKLLEKQKEGKKRLRQLGGLSVSAEIFPELLKP